MATLTKSRGRKPITSGKLMMSRFCGAVIDEAAGVTSGFRLLLPPEHGRTTGQMSLNITDHEAEQVVKFFSEYLYKDKNN